MVRRAWMVIGGLVIAGLSAACGGSTGGDGGAAGHDNGTPTGDCAGLDNVSDGPTTDAIGDNASAIVCYYEQPSEGYCRKITDATKIGSFYSTNKDKGAIGCKDAIIITDSECPTKNAVARCSSTTIEAERVYYTCSKFPDPAQNCSAVGGTYSAL